MDVTDSELIRSHCQGDCRAFGEIVRRYEKRLQNFICLKIGDREQAEDLVQETFLRVSKHAHRFDHSRQFMTWIYTIASNLAKNEIRNQSRSPLVFFQTLRNAVGDDEFNFDFEDPRARTDDLQHVNYLRERIHNVVAGLPEHHKQVFKLRELEGKSYEEIAEITHSGLGTVKSRLNRARISFAEHIEPFVD
ncbi:sigma-70 family RNA polymerase sigma factor [soil metagenome]